MFFGFLARKTRMYIGKTLFAQIMDFVPWTSFGRIVARYRGNTRVRSLPCTEQFRVMAFAQMTWRETGVVLSRLLDLPRLAARRALRPAVPCCRFCGPEAGRAQH
jgi:hypothetical protein